MLALRLMLSLVVGPALGTILLTYPPPRRHSTDFMQSQPNGTRCGVEKGNSTTDFPSGGTFNVTWYRSYPGEGRYKIELIDLDEGRQILLSADDKTTSIPSSAEQHRVTLPRAVTCRNCTLRLSRSLKFNGKEKEFNSCADINIVERREYKETCNSHGRAVLGRCRCEKLYHGERCQFKDECSAHRQCGKYGRCLQLSTQRYPRKRCACKVGYFGNFCQSRNPTAMRKKPENLLLYSSRRLSPAIVLYWRVLPDSQELEVVVKANTTSYLAIGWRPCPLPPTCLKSSQKEVSQEDQSGSPAPEATTVSSTKLVSSSSTTSPPITQSRSAREAEQSSKISTEDPTSTSSQSDLQSSFKTDVEQSATQSPSGMECVDMVIGRAVGEYGVVEDYFSSGVRTPQLDETIGGKQSLSATLAYEEQGSTTMMFRRRITATEHQDHSLTGHLDFVWAIGPTPEVHNSNTMKKKQNHGEDQVQYHGKRGDQRGSTDIEFVPNSEEEVAERTVNAYDVCGSEWLWPPSCSMSQANCQYGARWEYLDEEDAIRFTIQSAERDNWLGIGFSKTPTMSDSDVIMGHVRWSGRVTLHDRWSFGHLLPSIDSQQDMSDVTGTVKNGRQEISFVRKRDTKDSRDLAFTDSQCLFLLFPVGGGKYSAKWKRFSRHVTTPLVSTARVCIKSCRSVKLMGSDGKALPPPPPPYLYYDVRLLLGNMKDDVQIPVSGTKEFEYIKNRIRKDSEGVFREVPGFKQLTVLRLISSHNGPVVEIGVKIKRKDQQKEMERAKEENETAKTLLHMLNSTVNDGKVGRLRVSPHYVYVREISDDPTLTNDDRLEEFRIRRDPATKGWILFSVIGAMLITATLHAHRKCQHCAKNQHSKKPDTTEKQSMRGVPSSSHWRQIAERANRLPQDSRNTNDSVSAPPNSQTNKTGRTAEKRPHTASRNSNNNTRRNKNHDQAETATSSERATPEGDITDWEDVRGNRYARNWRHVENNHRKNDKRVCFQYS